MWVWSISVFSLVCIAAAVKMAECHAGFMVGVIGRHRVSNQLLQMIPGKLCESGLNSTGDIVSIKYI